MNFLLAIAVLLTGCDEAGRCSYVVEFPDQPMTVQGGDESLVLSKVFEFSLPETQHCFGAETFIGLDNGDRGEFDIGLSTASGYHILDRSFHRHLNGSFESWWPHYINVTAKDYIVTVIGRVIGENQFGELSARYHVGLKLQCQQTPTQPTTRPATAYIPWGDREEWARALEFAYTEWRGHRDLAALLARPEFLAGGVQELVPFSGSELREIMNKMAQAQADSRTLQARILTEKHRDFTDRSQVRKDVANKLKARLIANSAQYSAIAVKIPPQPGCDSIACRLSKM